MRILPSGRRAWGRFVLGCLVLTLPLLFPSNSTVAAENAGTAPPEQGFNPRVWVVPGIVPGEAQAWTLSGFYAGRGELTLRWAWIDPEGKHRDQGEFQLQGGRSADLRLPPPARGATAGACTLVLSGLDLDPSWVALRLWRPSTGGREELREGSWILSDPAWTAAKKTAF